MLVPLAISAQQGYQQGGYNPPNQASRPAVNSSVIRARDFQFTLKGCRSEASDVYCTFQVVNNSATDHRLKFGVGYNGSVQTAFVDPSGGTHQCADLRLANASGDCNAEFTLLSGIYYSLVAHFQNVGGNFSSMHRLTLGAAEWPDQGGPILLPIVYQNTPIQIGGQGGQLDTTSARGSVGKPPGASSIAPLVATPSAISARDFRFTMTGCNAESSDVYCKLQVVNNSAIDHRLKFGVGYNGSVQTAFVDPSGGTHQCADLRLANASGDCNTEFTLLSGINYALVVHFQNVGGDIPSMHRLTVGVAEWPDQGGPILLPIIYQNLPIQRGDAGAAISHPQGAKVDNRFVLTTPDWRIVAAGCYAGAGEMHCTVSVTSLRDVKIGLVVGVNNKQPVAIDDDGNTYSAARLYVRKSAGAVETEPGTSATFTLEPNANTAFDLVFKGIPDTLKTVHRFDLSLATNDNGKIFSVPSKFADVPVTPLPPNLLYS
jgi:hypothetical protein